MLERKRVNSKRWFMEFIFKYLIAIYGIRIICTTRPRNGQECQNYLYILNAFFKLIFEITKFKWKYFPYADQEMVKFNLNLNLNAKS